MWLPVMSNLTRWIRATRLNEPPPLLYRPNDHLLDNARLGLVSFSNFLIFKFCSNLLFQSIFSLVNAWVLSWDGFRWKPSVLGRVGICLGWVLIQGRPKMVKNTFWLHLHIHIPGVCVHVHLVCICINVHKNFTDTCFSMRTRMHTSSMHAHTKAYNHSFMPKCAISLFFHLFLSNMILMLLFLFSFCKIRSLTRVGIVLATYSNGISPWWLRQRLWWT